MKLLIIRALIASLFLALGAARCGGDSAQADAQKDVVPTPDAAKPAMPSDTPEE
mgnify:CR=1 FL=1